MDHHQSLATPEFFPSAENVIEYQTPSLEDKNIKNCTERNNSVMNQHHDYSSVEIVGSQEHSGKKARPGKLSFPQKLHLILSNQEHQHIITWLTHGRSWCILERNKFEEEVIPLYFQHRNLASFMRQVSAWGFRRVSQGPDRKSYYHKVR